MIVATVIQNPIDPLNSRKIIHLAPGTNYLEAADILFPASLPARNIDLALDIVFAVDGQIVTPTDVEIIPDGVSLVACLVPHGGGNTGKLIIKVVASIVIAVAAAYTGGVAAAAYGPLWGGVVASTVMIAGSMLVNAVLPMNAAQASMESSLSQSPTYSWDVHGNKFQESISLPELYGTHRIKPPIIGMYVETSGNEQILNLLFAISKWQIDTITGIKINGTDIADFPSVQPPVLRMGTNNQEIVQAFSDTRHDTPVGLEIISATEWTVKNPTGNANTGLGIGVVFPAGLFVSHPDGLAVACVMLQIEYKKSTDSEWTALSTDTSGPSSTIGARWSGGYWTTQEDGETQIWNELEAGSSTPGDHTEGELYTPDPSVWVYPNDIYAQNGSRPITQWHWVENATIIIPAGATTLPYVAVSAAYAESFRRSWYRTGLPAGTYSIRVKLYEALPTGIEWVTKTYWEFYQEIVEDDFTYPNTCVMGLYAIATSALSGSLPTVEMTASRNTVYVWDPDLAAYSAKEATNPAWLCYDLLHKCRYIININNGNTPEYVVFGEPHARIDYAAFKVWADWCDDVTAPKVKYTCNIYFDVPVNLRKALDIVGICGRGAVLQLGSNFTCIVEKPETTPVQRFLFTSANIIKDSFEESFISLADRANMVEVTYRDKDDDYNSQIVEVHADDFDTTTDEVRKSSIDLIGCTDHDMAANFGKFLLNCNRNLTAVASWTADIDAIACMPGDIVEVPRSMTRSQNSGRLLDGCWDTVLLLDKPVTLVDGTDYTVSVKHATVDDLMEYADILPWAPPVGSLWRGVWDGGETYALGDLVYKVDTNFYTLTAMPATWTICPTEGVTEIIVTATALTRAPLVDAMFSFGEEYLTSKLMRVVKISRDSEMRRKITAVEFVNECFDDSTDIPVCPFPRMPASMIPPALDSVVLQIAWILDNSTKTWQPFVQATFNADTTALANLSIPISKYRVYVHSEAGDTHTDPMSYGYDMVFDWDGGLLSQAAGPFTGKTLYLTATLVNINGTEGPKCTAAVLYVNPAYAVSVTSQVEVDSTLGTLGYDYQGADYFAYIKWVPSGWGLVAGKYAPIKTWNGGNNYYNLKNYLVVWGLVDTDSEIPDFATLNFYETANIGDIYDPNGVEYTNTTLLDAICRGAASLRLQFGYQAKYVAISMVPILKTGETCLLDTAAADLGLDWEYLHVTCPGGTGSTVEDVQITNAELVYTVQPGMVVLNEMNWDYTLVSPAIDGFAVIARIQPYWWSWQFSGSFAANVTDISTFLAAINFTTSGGGSEAAADLVDRYGEWYAGGVPYFYMMISSATHYEVIRINAQTLVITRGVEGTTARAWSVGDWVSYCPCEQIDSVGLITDTTQRSYVFNPPVQVNFALHATMVAYKLVDESPGYKRCHYAFWDYVRLR